MNLQSLKSKIKINIGKLGGRSLSNAEGQEMDEEERGKKGDEERN